MSVPKDALQPEPMEHDVITRGKIFDEMTFLYQIGIDPKGMPNKSENFSIKATEHFYRQHLTQRKAESRTYFSHIQPSEAASAEVASLAQRHNMRATIANLATEWFMIEKMSYQEFIVIARGLGYDTVLDLQGEEAADNYLDTCYEPDEVDDIYEDFPNMINAAMNGNYAFPISESSKITKKQEHALTKLRSVASMPFKDVRNDIVAYPYMKNLDPNWTEAQKTARFDLYSYTEDLLNEFPYEENGIGLKDQAIVSQFQWDALHIKKE